MMACLKLNRLETNKWLKWVIRVSLQQKVNLGSGFILGRQCRPKTRQGTHFFPTKWASQLMCFGSKFRVDNVDPKFYNLFIHFLI